MLHILLSKPPVTYLTIVKLLPGLSYLSDHSQVVTWVELYTTLETNKDIPSQPPTEKLPLQYIWTDDSNDAFIKELKSIDIQSQWCS
jgi:hypothetical protein